MPAGTFPSANRLPTLLVLFSVLTTGVGQSMTFALLAPLGREIGFRELQVGLIITCSALVFTLSSPAWGRVCDRWGRRPTLVIGQLGYAFGCLLFAGALALGLRGLLAGLTLYLLAIASRVLMAALISASPAAASAYIADTTTPEQRTRGMGRLGAARTLGAILGPAMGGALVAFGLLTPFYIASGLALLSSLLLFASVREPSRQPHAAVAHQRLRLFDRRYFPFLAVGFLTFFAFSMMSQTIGFYLQDRFVLDAKATAQALGAGLMLSALMSLLAQTLVVRRAGMTPLRLMRRGLPVLLVGFLGLLVAGSIPLLVIAMGVIGLGLGMVAPGFTAGASLAVGPDEQGAVGGLVSACPAGGFVLGPLVGTSLYQLQPVLPYLVAALLMIPLAVYTWRLRLPPRSEAD